MLNPEVYDLYALVRSKTVKQKKNKTIIKL